MRLILLFCILSVPLFSLGQAAKPKPRASAVPDTLFTALGSFRGINLGADQLKPLIDSSLKVTDGAGNFYPVDSFIFYYTQKDETLNEETNRKETFFYTVEYRSNAAELPELWRKVIKGKLRKDETISFERVLIKLPNGKLYLAPPLKIQVQ